MGLLVPCLSIITEFLSLERAVNTHTEASLSRKLRKASSQASEPPLTVCGMRPIQLHLKVPVVLPVLLLILLRHTDGQEKTKVVSQYRNFNASSNVPELLFSCACSRLWTRYERLAGRRIKALMECPTHPPSHPSKK
ncbi:hypothetical protein BT69DRAFT_1108236 [Atractiella rhizophila]|nr:hypothetical protein BT69DRAFT_1108236 [Atractiella rhizophila]